MGKKSKVAWRVACMCERSRIRCAVSVFEWREKIHLNEMGESATVVASLLAVALCRHRTGPIRIKQTHAHTRKLNSEIEMK